MTELENELALRAIETINKPTFTVSATLDLAKPETIKNFALFGKLLAEAYERGRLVAIDADDYSEAYANHQALVRELDVLLNGEEGAAPQASLCDIVAQVRGKLKDPDGYIHGMVYETGHTDCTVTSDQENPWGVRGINYDQDFDVLTQALIAVGPITKV